MALNNQVIKKPKKKISRQKERIEPHFLPLDQRIAGFKEVNLGYLSLDDEVLLEALRCLECGKPKCVEGCKAKFDIPTFMKHMKDKDFGKAKDLLFGTYCFPKSIDRICPRFCEQACILGKKGDSVQIMYIKRFLADKFDLPNDYDSRGPLTGKKVAIIGSGPAGLTSAYYLSKKGHDVTVFEKTNLLGGMLTLGIPEYRLPQKIMQQEISNLTKLNIQFETDQIYGEDFNYETLFNQGFQAILIAHGAHKPKWMGLNQELELVGSWHAVDFLREISLGNEFDLLGKKIAVIGGGDVAIDAVRIAKRLGADSQIWYRRAKEQMPAEKEEIHATEEEGIPINFLRNPVEIIGKDGKIIGMKVIKMELGEPDDSNRRRPVSIINSEYTIDVDIIIQAISQEPELVDKGKFEMSRWNTFIVNEETMATNIHGVFAAGDNVTGPDTGINAINHGHKAVRAIHEFLMN